MSAEFNNEELDLINRIDRLDEIFRNTTISFDIDQVEVDSAFSAVSELNRRFVTDYTVGDITKYWALVDIIKKERPKIQDPKSYSIALWNDPEIISHAPPISGSLLFSKHLFESGVNAFRITSRPFSLAETTLAWYKKFMPWVGKEYIRMQTSGNEIRSDFKVEEIKKLGVQIHFEDSIEHAEEIVSETNATVVLVPQPWNNYNEHNYNKIITIPEHAYRGYPKMIRVWFHLMDRLV